MSDLQKKLFLLLVVLLTIYSVNIYKNQLIVSKIEEEMQKKSSLSSSSNIICRGYLDIDCDIEKIDLIFDKDASIDFKIPDGLLPKSAKLKIDISQKNIKLNLYLNTDYLDINLEFKTKESIFGDMEIFKAIIENKRDTFDMIYEIYRVNFLEIKKNSNIDFVRGVNKALGVDSTDLIDKNSFRGEPFIEFFDIILSEIGNSMGLNEKTEDKISDFILNNRANLTIGVIL